MYKATNIDTDKALEAIETFRRRQSKLHQHELYGLQKYYEGVEKGLELAESLFECSCYEKDESESTQDYFRPLKNDFLRKMAKFLKRHR